MLGFHADTDPVQFISHYLRDTPPPRLALHLVFTKDNRIQVISGRQCIKATRDFRQLNIQNYDYLWVYSFLFPIVDSSL